MSASRSANFEVASRVGTAGELHSLDLPEPLTRQVWVLGVSRPALVLGSGQDAAVVDAAACSRAGVDVTRRRSGGGLVLLEPDHQAWVDVLIPVDDPLWEVDLTRAFGWLARAWQRALRSLGIETGVVEGRLEVGSWGQLVCFAGRGPGELLLGGSKVVGMSLRRTRSGARFQTMALSEWRPEALVALVAPGLADPTRLLDGIATAGAGLHHPPGVLSDALIAALSDTG